MFAFGIFWIFGTPVQVAMAIAVNSVMTFNVFYNYQITLQGDQFNETQTAAFSFWTWIWESVIFWGLGTQFYTWSIVLASLIPIFGPTINLTLILIFMLTSFN